MADSKSDNSLDPGFDEITLDKGFEPVPLTDNEKTKVINLVSTPLPSKTQSALQGLAQGGTFGFAPRIGAGLGVSLEKLAGSTEDSKNKSIKDLYNEYLDYNNKLQERARAANPGIYGAGMLAGAAASPLNKIGGLASSIVPAGPAASMPLKMLASGVGGAAVGGTAGLSQSPDLTNIPQDIQQAGQGMAFGGALGAAAPPIASTLGGIARGTASGLRTFFGPVGETASSGYQDVMAGKPNLSTAAGQQTAQNLRTQYAKDFINNLKSTITGAAKDKWNKLDSALSDLPRDQVDPILQQVLDMDPSKLGTDEANELLKVKEEILRAKEGPLQTQTIRQYTPQTPQPPMPPSPEGYKKVLSQTVDKDDSEAIQAFQQKIKVKEAEERALPGQVETTPIEITSQPIEGSPDQIQLIARRPIATESGQDFTQQAQQVNQPYQDIQTQVRPGDRNILAPSELYNLQQLMKEYGGGRLQTDTMTGVARDVSKKLANVLKSNVGTDEQDQILHSFNNIAENLGIDPYKLQAPGGTGQNAQESALNKMFDLMNPKNLSDSTLMNQEKIGYIADQLNNIDPQLSQEFQKNVAEQAQSKGLIKEFTQPYEPTGINPLLNVIRKKASQLSYGAGYGLGQQQQRLASEIGPTMQSGVEAFQKYTPDSLQQVAQKAMSSGSQTTQQFGQVLSKLSTADDRTRNAMLFVMQQQPGYQQLMQQYFPTEQPSTQKKDNELQKFK